MKKMCALILSAVLILCVASACTNQTASSKSATSTMPSVVAEVASSTVASTAAPSTAVPTKEAASVAASSAAPTKEATPVAKPSVAAPASKAAAPAVAEVETNPTPKSNKTEVTTTPEIVKEPEVEEEPEEETPSTPEVFTNHIVDFAPAVIIVHRISCFTEVYNKNMELLRSMVCSTGRDGHETPSGDFSIYEHTTSGYHLMVDGTYARYCMRFASGGYMFHSVCFSSPGDSYPIQEEVNDLGTRVSAGCVRLSVADAAWLYSNVPNGCAVKILNN